MSTPKAGQDHQPAHGRRTLLGDEMRRRTIAADRLAFSLLETQHVDDRAREQEDENKGGDDCAARTEGDVTKDVEKRDFVGKLGQPIEHRVGSLLSAWRSLERG